MRFNEVDVRLRMQKNRPGFHTTGMVFSVLAVVLMGFLLWSDEWLPFSIGAVWRAVAHGMKTPHSHLLSVGLLPVYVALMLFGAAFVGDFAADIVRSLLRRFNASN